jgi:chromosome segregation ATPase
LSYEVTIRDQEATIVALRQQLSNFEGQISMYLTQINELRARPNNESELNALRVQLSAYETRIQELEGQLSMYLTQINELRARPNNEGELNALRVEVQNLRATLSAL